MRWNRSFILVDGAESEIPTRKFAGSVAFTSANHRYQTRNADEIVQFDAG